MIDPNLEKKHSNGNMHLSNNKRLVPFSDAAVRRQHDSPLLVLGIGEGHLILSRPLTAPQKMGIIVVAQLDQTDELDI